MAKSISEVDDFLGVKPVPRWRRWVKWIVIAVVLLAAVLLAMRFFGGSKEAHFATTPAERGNLSVTVSATGKLAPTNQVQVGSELSGLVEKVLVDVNDQVRKGEVIALIDPSRFRDEVTQSAASLNASEAAVAQARATVAESKASLARLQEVSRLSGGKVPAKTEMESAQAAYDRAVASLRSAEANVQSARAVLSSNQTQLTKAVIRSPVDGVVLARQIEPGQTVAASFNTPNLFVIAEDLRQMKLEVAIDEADVGEVKQGQKADFTVDAFPGRVFPATIKRVDLGSNLSTQTSSSAQSSAAGSTQSQVVSYAATLTVANPDLQLRPGMTATAEIVTNARQNALLVPNAALRFRPASDDAPSARASGGITGALVPRRRRRGGGGDGQAVTLSRGAQQTVYILADGRPKPVSVTTGVTNGTMTEVTGGDLKPGDQVITGQLAAGASESRQAGGRQRQGAGGGARSGQ